MTRQTAIVIAPGRGVYGQTELGYLHRHHQDKTEFLNIIDAYREEHGRIPVTTLDQAPRYAAGKHASSQNASALIYACAVADFADIDQDKFDIVAVAGNSLGWYLALSAAQALPPPAAIKLIDTMGTLMETHGVGGQLVYPMVNAQWQADPARQALVAAALDEAAAQQDAEAFVSIYLGGMAVLAGNENGLSALEEALPQADERFPFRLARHSAFHTPLLTGVSEMAKAALPASLFARPRFPLIDGTGKVWRPYDDLAAMHDYTLGDQITTTYNFTKSIEVAIKEFAPDRLIVLGPGSTLGPPVAQTLIAHQWRGMESKAEFVRQQGTDPFVLAMGIDAQRAHVVAG